METRTTIALADDDVVLTDLVTAWLEHSGYEVVRFESGNALVSWARETRVPVDAFLLDVDMPGLDGFESCVALGEIPQFAGTPKLFVSSMPAEILTDRVADVGGAVLLRKDSKLLPRLTEWLGANLMPA
jgi:DNA-binding response OmpR family regulator